MAAKLNSYADVQNLLNNYVQSAGVTPASAPHGTFWETLSYQDFITQQVPNLPDVRICTPGTVGTSGIINALSGTGQFMPQGNEYPQMPFGNPPYPGQQDVIDSLSDWISRNCPNGNASAPARRGDHSLRGSGSPSGGLR
jgi:hypothetical protein